MPRIELADLPSRAPTRVADAWGAILDDSAFDKPEIFFEDAVAPFCRGDLADIHVGEYNGLKVAVKVTRDIGDNDLVAHEVAILEKLYPPGTPDEKFFRYLPPVILSTRWEDRQVNVFPWLDGYVSLEAIHQAYPAGIDFRDMVWMFKRLLVGIGFAHLRDFVHGSILPSHVMVHPLAHGAKIIDWSYAIENASRKTDRVRAMSRPFQAFYAPEILDRQAPTPATDIFMAAKCAIWLLGGDVSTNVMPDTVPAGIRSFLENCAQEHASMRPQDAWVLHEEFDQLLQQLVGKPSYRPFMMP